MQAKKRAFHEYSRIFVEKEREKEMILLEKEQLQMKIASQIDPAWIEMILMRDLGMVPEGYLKVHFKNSV